MDNDVAYILFIIISAIIATLLIRYIINKYLKLKHLEIMSNQEFKQIEFLFLFYVLLQSPNIVLDFFPYQSTAYSIRRIISTPLYFVINIIPVYIGAILFYRKFINPFNKVKNEGSLEALNESVKKVFNSNDFYNALSTVLPKGEDDKKYGLDYIPFMLQNLKDKRLRFQKSSYKFLITTIVLSVFFVIITIFFSYILINDSSIGIYSDVKDVKKKFDEFNRSLSYVKTNINEKDYFFKMNSIKLNGIQEYYKSNLSDKDNQLIYQVKELIFEFKKSGDVKMLYPNLKTLQDSLETRRDSKNNEYLNMLDGLTNSIENYIIFQDKTFREMELTQQELTKLIPKIEENLDKPQNKQNELIKRLILSVVVITFFITILRYFRNLYRLHYQEMLKAEEQDLLIRKFYVGLKTSENNPEERKIVLSNFISLSNEVLLQKETDKFKSQKIENSVLKDTLQALLKKL